MLKLLLYIFILSNSNDSKLHNNEACVPLGDIFLAIEIESIGTIISKRNFVSSD